MPLSEKARIELYVPDFPDTFYQLLLGLLEQELTHSFGRSTLICGLDGSYLLPSREEALDRVNLLYADTPFPFDANVDRLSEYIDGLRYVIAAALKAEEIIPVVVYKVHQVVPARS